MQSVWYYLRSAAPVRARGTALIWTCEIMFAALGERFNCVPMRVGSVHEATPVERTTLAGSDHEAAVCVGALVAVIGATAIGVLGVGIETMFGL